MARTGAGVRLKEVWVGLDREAATELTRRARHELSSRSAVARRILTRALRRRDDEQQREPA
jgi:metal-responsive CopG/Arc/MetJ family transcriptional regulator